MSEHAKSLTKTTILRQKQVSERTGLSRSSIYDKLNPQSPRHDPSFPRQVQLGPASVGWRESEIDVWIETRVSTKHTEEALSMDAKVVPQARPLDVIKTVKTDLNPALDNERIAKVRKILEENAKRGTGISYAEVMAAVRLWHDDFADREIIDRILADITKTSHTEGIGLLGVLVHDKPNGFGRPSDVFFDLAKSLGYTITPRSRFVSSQIEQLYEFYESPASKKRGKLTWIQTKQRILLTRR